MVGLIILLVALLVLIWSMDDLAPELVAVGLIGAGLVTAGAFLSIVAQGML